MDLSNFDKSLDMKTIILAVSLIINVSISILFYLRNRTYGFENSFNERLFQIQKLAFEYPFVEDKNFINNWDDSVEKYRDNKFTVEEKEGEVLKRILQYEQYCEMIFNLIEDNFTYKKSEKYLQRNIDFKSWAKAHQIWWENPLEKNSNRKAYDNKLVIIIDNWIISQNECYC